LFSKGPLRYQRLKTFNTAREAYNAKVTDNSNKQQSITTGIIDFKKLLYFVVLCKLFGSANTLFHYSSNKLVTISLVMTKVHIELDSQ